MSDPSVTIDLAHLAVELIPTAIIGLVLWAGRKVISDQKEGTAELKLAVEKLTATVERLKEEKHGDDTALRLLEDALRRIEKETNLNRDRYHSLASDVTWMRGRLLMRTDKQKTGEHPILHVGDEEQDP